MGLTSDKNISKQILKGCIVAALLLSVFFFLSLEKNSQNKIPASKQDAKISSPEDSIRNHKAIDSAISILRSGDLVLRRGADVTSYMFSHTNQKNKSYSHCGLVMIENGYPFVYHSIGGEDNPNGRLRRDSASFFFSPANNLAFGIARFDMPDSTIERLKQIVREFYNEHRKFDVNFDLKTDDRLYCSEFVYKAVNKACRDTNYIKPVSILGFSYVGIDNLFINPHAKLIWQVKFK